MSLPDFIDLRFDALLGVSRQLFPLTVPGTGQQDEWLVTGPALIARAARSLEALLALRPAGLDNDAYTVLRSLYEHVARFAYVAANPVEHLPLWLKWDRAERITADNDMTATSGETFISADAREYFVTEEAAIPGQWLGLRQQVDKADE